MLDVHPPHHSVNTWRDFLLHIFTITIGLLIALGLEAGVEALHHRHLVREARENLTAEITTNRRLIARDRDSLEADRRQLLQDLAVLRDLQPAPGKPHSPIEFHWQWSSPAEAAWHTARDTGALALMSSDKVEGYSLVYTQQDYVNQQATTFITNQMHIGIPIKIHEDVATLSPAQIDEVMHSCATSLSDIDYLEVLMDGLDQNYISVLNQL